MNRDEAFAKLTGPGGNFEVAERAVLGHSVKVFIHAPRNLGELLEASAEHGDKEYLIADSTRLTFEEHLRRVRATALLLKETYKVQPGDRVAVFAMNRPEWVIMFWAVTSIGAVLTAGNSMGVTSEIQHQIDLTTPVLILHDEHLTARVEACDAQGATVSEMSSLIDEAIARYPEPEASLHSPKPDDPAVIIFTSGTTGKAKGATHSHRNVITAIWFHRLNDAIATLMGNPPKDRKYLLASPLFHISSLHNLSVTRLVTGDTVVMLTGKFDPVKVLELIERERITNWGAVPTMINRVLRENIEGYDLSSLKVLTINSAPSTQQLQQEVRQRIPQLANTFGTSYGLTESSSAATIATPDMFARDPLTVGKPIATMELEVRRADGTRAPEGEEGEIFLRGPLVMLGYWGMGERAGIQPDGWFGTGDLGFMSEGELKLRTRRSDLILRGGENVYPAEVEGAIIDFPEVTETVVFGVEDEDFGQKVVAVVVTPHPETFEQEKLHGFLRERLAKYKLPSTVHVTSTPLPRNATGKVVRRLLDPSLLRGEASSSGVDAT